jgi:putative endonuclease
MATHNDHGQAGEEAVANYLQANGFEILDQNWKNRWGEIDIVAKKDGVVHFVEVKYRQSSAQGSGFDYITPAKLRQMGFAASMWTQHNRWNGDYVLSAAQVSGADYEVEFIENCGF